MSKRNQVLKRGRSEPKAKVEHAKRRRPGVLSAGKATSGGNEHGKAQATKGADQAVGARTDDIPEPTKATKSNPITKPERARDPRLPLAGTTLVKRDRHGRAVAECLVRDEDVVYRGAVYASLSGAATAAARERGQRGTVNGFVYFGLSKPSAKARPPAERLRRLGERFEEQVEALLRPGGATVADHESIEVAIDLHVARIQRVVSRNLPTA